MGRGILRGIALALVVSGVLAAEAVAATGPAIVGYNSSSSLLPGATAVAVSGNLAYEVSYWSGQLNVIDISNPSIPTIVGSTPALNMSLLAATNVTVSGNDAFVTSKNRNNTCTPGPVPNCSMGSNDDGSGNSLTIVDITNPTTPTIVGSVTDSANPKSALFGAYSVAISGTNAYVASQGILGGQPGQPSTTQGSLSTIDITNPGTPVLGQTINNSTLGGGLTNALDHATSVAISGNFAYVTAFNGQGLAVVSLSTPAAPSVVNFVHDPINLSAPDDVAIQGSYAYVANQVPSGLELTILSLANPASPTVVGTLSDPSMSGAYRLKVRGNLVYVTGNNTASVAAVDVSNPSAPRLAGSVTDAIRLSNTTGLDVSASGRYVVATAPRLASDPGTTYPPYPRQGGPTVTGAVSVIDLDPVPISVAITSGSKPANPSTHSTANFSFSTSDAVATVQCSLDGGALGLCSSGTTARYSGLSNGMHTFKVQATDATGATAQDSYSWSIATGGGGSPGLGTAPGNTSLPTISGTAQWGKRLSAGNGKWSGTGPLTYRYTWQRCNSSGKACRAISSQTQSTYTVTAADLGSRLDVVVTASNSAGSAFAISLPTKVVSWSATSSATGSVTGSKSSRPGLSLTVPSLGAGFSLQKLAISLPKGVSFVGTHGLSVRSLSNKALSFTVSLKHGVLTIVLKKPATGVKLTFKGLLRILGALEHQIKTHKVKSVALTVTLSYSGKPAWRGTVTVRLA